MDKGVLAFGQELLDTGDLDPVYNYLSCQEFSSDKLKRWLLAYSMFYHCGVANYLSEFKEHEYWEHIKEDLKEFPRGEERRHFRGQQAAKSVEFMCEYLPESIVDSWYKKPIFKDVVVSVKRLPIYGQWIAFKMADMGERVLRIPIDFSECELEIYKEPKAGAALVLYENEDLNITKQEIHQAVYFITEYLNAKNYKAPPWNDRPLNVQEAETILCKYKSHKHGHYFVGKDIEAVKKAVGWNV